MRLLPPVVERVVPRSRAACWTGLALLLGATLAGAAPWPRDDELASDEPQQPALLHRLAYTLNGLRHAAGDDRALRDTLSRMRLEVPLDSQLSAFPNAYAVPGEDRQVIRFETDFARQLTGMSNAGAYLELAQWAGDEASARDHLCAIMRTTVQEAGRTGRRPIFGIDLRRLPQAQVPETLRGLQQLRMAVMDDVLAWVLLHEAGHHVAQHRSALGEPSADSRRREDEADAFASRAMLRLGFGLHRVERFLSGMAAMEACARPLGYDTPEHTSTHPSWTTRVANLRRGFDVSGVGDGYPRLYIIPATPMDTALIVAEPRRDSETRMILTGGPGTVPQATGAASQWRAKAVTIYVREGDDMRVELHIADAHAPVADVELRRFNGDGRAIGTPMKLPAVQLSPNHLAWLQVAPGILSGDLRNGGEQALLRSVLAQAGIATATADRVLAAAQALRNARTAIIVGYMKGELTRAESEKRLRPDVAIYVRQWEQLLDPAQRASVREAIDSHPLRQWAPGQAAAAYDDVLKSAAERNWSWLPR